LTTLPNPISAVAAARSRAADESDFGQEWGWHGKDRGVSLERGATVTAHGNPTASLVDRHYGRSEMEGGAVPAAFG